MKSLMNLAFLLVFFFSTSGLSKVAGQAKIPLSPDNINGIIEHIDYRYSNIISTDLNIVKNKLSNEFIGLFDPQLSAPEPNIKYMTETTISFFWPSIPGTQHVNVYYFNLNSGQINTIDSVQVDSVSVIFPSDEAYLFAFQGIGLEGEKGEMSLMVADHSFDFIIVDKDVLRSDIPFEYMTCGCNSGNITEYDVYRDQLNSIFIPWLAPCESSKYNLDIQVLTTLQESHFVSLDFVHDPESYDDPLVHSLNYCSHPGFSTPYNLGIPDLCETVVTSRGVTLYIDPEMVETISFTPTVCSCATHKGNKPLSKESRSQGINIQSFPNPVDHYATIDYSIPTAGALSIILYDSFSKEVQQLKQNEFHEKGTYNFSFATENLPAGIYNCALIFEGRTKTTRLVKLKL